MDLADRKIIGWTLSKDMTVENTMKAAWVKARNDRDIVPGFIFHSDRGVQYAAKEIVALLIYNPKAQQSMSRKGNCWDNAVAESFFKTIKHEWLYRFSFQNYEQASHKIDEYISWYNNERIHSLLGYKTPVEMEIQLKGFIKIVA